MPLVSLEGLVRFWQETKEEDDPYIMVTLRGRFKKETGVQWHCLPIPERTTSGIPHQKWVRVTGVPKGLDPGEGWGGIGDAILKQHGREDAHS